MSALLLAILLLPSVVASAVNDVTGTLEYYNGLGFDLYQEGKYQQAIEMYQKALSCNGETGRARVRNNLGAAYYALKKYSDAEDQYAEAVSLNPDFTKARVNLAAAHFRQGNYFRAALALRKARKSDPDYVSTRLDNEQSREELRKENEKNPGDPFLTKLVALVDTEAEASTSAGLDAKVAEIYEKTNDRFQRLKSYSSRVVRKSKSPKGEARQEWTVQLELPEKIRLEWLGAEPMTFVCSGTEAWYYDPKAKEVVHVTDMDSENIPDLDLGLNVLPKYIQTHTFALSPDSPEGEWFLVGVSDAKADRVARVHLWLDSHSSALLKSELFDREGRMRVKTEYSHFKEFEHGLKLPGRCRIASFSSDGKMDIEMIFLDLKVNEELTGDLFQFEVPEGAKVIEQ